jgi:hypothetical protein
MFQAGASKVVARAKAAVFVHHELRHHEQANALHAGRSGGRAGQDQMDDIVGEIMLTIGDENLLAGDQPGAVILRHRLGTDSTYVGTGLRLRQVHGAGPFTADQLFQILALLLRRSMGLQELHSALVQHGAQREGHVGRCPHLLDGQG